MTALWLAGATIAGLFAAHYLPRADAGLAAFAVAALLTLAGALRQRRRTRAQQAHEAQAFARDARAYDAPAPAGDERKRGRARVWALCVMGVAAGLGALVWTLGLLVTGLGLGLLTAASIYFLHIRRRVAELRVTPLSTPLDRDGWMSGLPGRVADAVDAARLVRGHADAAGVHAAESAGEGAA